jgi:hypothetical protein
VGGNWHYEPYLQSIPHTTEKSFSPSHSLHLNNNH